MADLIQFHVAINVLRSRALVTSERNLENKADTGEKKENNNLHSVFLYNISIFLF